MMNKKAAYIITTIVVLIFAVFFLYPVGLTLASACINESGGFTLDFFIAVFRNPIYREGLWNSLLMGIFSTLAALVIAFPLAIISHRYIFPGKKLLGILVLAPLVLPPFVGAVGIKQVMGVSGSLNAFLMQVGLMDPASPMDWLGEGRFLGVVIMNALHLYPILLMSIAATLSRLDPSMEQAAENLGCTPWRRFRRITLPLCVPGIFAGASIVFVWSFTELGVPLVFDYSGVASVQAYDGIKDLNQNPLPYALIGVMLIISSIVFICLKLISRQTRVKVSPRSSGKIFCYRLSGWKAWAVSSSFAAIFCIACIPHIGVFFLSVQGDWYSSIFPESFTAAHYKEALGHPIVVPSIQNSLLYSAGSTVIDMILGTAIAWVIVRSSIKGRAVLDTLMMLPLVVPGIVLAFGYLAVTEPGQPLHFLVGEMGDPLFILIIVYAMRRLPYVVRAAVSGLQQSNVSLEEAAQTLGVKPARVIRKIALPLLSANLVAGGILAFAFAMLEVSDSLILAQQVQHYPIIKAIYSLLNTLGNGYQLASALGVWSMIFLGLAIAGVFFILGKKGGRIFKA